MNIPLPPGTRVHLGPLMGTVKGSWVHDGKAYCWVEVDPGPPEPLPAAEKPPTEYRTADEMWRVRE